MKTPIAAVLAATLILSGCGGFRDSKLNPVNWFGRSSQGPVGLEPDGGYAAATGDFRALVGEVTSMEVNRIQGGALLSAAGLPPTQGWWDAELVPEADEKPVDGVLAYRFVVAEPRVTTRVSTPQSREVTAARFLSDQTLQGVSRIVVLGERNSRSSRR